MILIPKLRIGYQNVPKVATTSIFSYLYLACHGVEYQGHKINQRKVQSVHNYFRHRLEESLVLANSKQVLQGYEDYFSFAITRDPVKRFISMYSNRVVHYRELSAETKHAAKLIERGLEFDPQINLLVQNLEGYMECQPSIFHHARPQMDFLGPDLSVYNRIVDISEVNGIINEIREFWRKEGMSELCNRTPQDPGRKQTGGPKLELYELLPESFEKLLEYYSEDYKNLPTVSLSEIKNQYLAAREKGAPKVLVFPKLEQVVSKKKGGIATKTSEMQAKIQKMGNSMIEMLRIDLPEGVSPAKPFMLKGAVILKGMSRDGWKLLADDGRGEREMEWGLPSPGLQQRYAGNADAGTARFKLKDVRLLIDNEIKIYIHSGKKRELLATIKFERK